MEDLVVLGLDDPGSHVGLTLTISLEYMVDMIYMSSLMCVMVLSVTNGT